MFDWVIRGGTVVTAESRSVCDIGILDGRIARLGGVMTAAREIDARDRFVFPGGVDLHVHLTPPRPPRAGEPTWVDDFASGSRAALAGGITTIGNMTFQRRGETLHDALARDLALAARDALVDFVLHPVLTDPSARALDEIPELAAEGHTSLKIFLVQDDFDARLAEFVEALYRAARGGLLSLLHCEDNVLIRCVCRDLLMSGRTAPHHWPEGRPEYSEVVAVERAIGFSRATGAPIYIVHLSSARALEACRRARADGVEVYVETRPMYLHLTRERFAEPDGAKYVGAPPLREGADREAMWQGLAEGDIHCLCSDHAPWTLAHKLDPALDVTTARQGVADLETLMPMLFSEGVRQGRLSLQRFVEVTSTNAAKLAGLYPRKGTIAVGSDADLVVWDAERRVTVDGAAMWSKAGYSVYDGWQVQGWPTHTLRRGELLFEHGEMRAPAGQGIWLRRERPMKL